jgi:hypothetical protein
MFPGCPPDPIIYVLSLCGQMDVVMPFVLGKEIFRCLQSIPVQENLISLNHLCAVVESGV